MEILQFLLSFFSSEYKGGKFQPLFDLLKENSFNIGETIKRVKPEMLAPLISEFAFKNNSSPSFNDGEVSGLTPISQIADQNIVNSLNCYLGSH